MPTWGFRLVPLAFLASSLVCRWVLVNSFLLGDPLRGGLYSLCEPSQTDKETMEPCFLITLSWPLRVTIPVALVRPGRFKAVMSAAPSVSGARAKALLPPQALGRGIPYSHPSAVSSIARDRSPKPEPRKGSFAAARPCAAQSSGSFGPAIDDDGDGAGIEGVELPNGKSGQPA